MKTNCIPAAVMAMLLFSALGCKETELLVNGQGWASVHLKAGEKVTWTAEHAGDLLQLEFQGPLNHSPCEGYDGLVIPEKPARSVTCKIRADSDLYQAFSYRITLTSATNQAATPSVIKTVSAAMQPSPGSAPRTDCHYCDVIIGKRGDDQGTSSPPPPPSGTPQSFTRTTDTNGPSGIHFSCKDGAPVINAAEQIITLHTTDLPGAKTWVPVNTTSSWAVTFSTKLCEEGTRLSSTDATNFRCTITSSAPVDKYLYSLAAHGCTPNGGQDKVTVGRIDVSGAAAPSSDQNR